VIWLLQDFDLLSVLLRALTLSFEALTVGGVFFALLIATPGNAEPAARAAGRRFAGWAALALAIAQMLATAESAAMLMGESGLRLRDVVSADFFFADVTIIVAALALFVLACRHAAVSRYVHLPLALLIVAGSVALSHAAAQLDHRFLLVVLTAAHHLASAAWIGAMPFLLATMRRSDDARRLHVLVRRFSAMAMVSVAVLVLAGIGMACFYVGSWSGLYGTSYGLLMLAKVYVLALILTLGGSNYLLLKRTRHEEEPFLMRLRRFSEAEIGLGFTAILIGASLTSQPPAADMKQDTLTTYEIVQRIKWEQPTLTTPAFAQLHKPGPLKAKLESDSFTGGSPNDAMDQAWSEYNHHWAGIIVLAAGVFALLSRIRGTGWARHWPLLFIGLAVFIVLRADPETWPLGPRSFWGSFAEAEVLEHRVFAALITAFAVFEWAVETGRLQSRRAALVFPALCALGGAFLLTHSHALGDPKDETLVAMSHAPIALLGATAGWSRWVQLRLPAGDDAKIRRMLGWIWPLCLVLVGCILLNYRES
jgi:copper resistance protein D